ncbi:MAG: hypothetical protein P4M12_10015 [Gammaproteobacteria bacterium]|nr:hypothetical protein [Gammaproteobacteria bacterium]
MYAQEIEIKKSEAFETIRDILLDLPENPADETEKTDHILDLLEQILARIIASSCLEPKHVKEMCAQSTKNIETMALEFLEEELNEENDD